MAADSRPIQKASSVFEEPDTKRASRSAFTIALAYIAGDLVPLTPYFLFPAVKSALIGSVVVTLLAPLVFEFVKGRFTTARPFRIAFQTLMVGGEDQQGDLTMQRVHSVNPQVAQGHTKELLDTRQGV